MRRKILDIDRNEYRCLEWLDRSPIGDPPDRYPFYEAQIRSLQGKGYLTRTVRPRVTSAGKQALKEYKL